MDFSLGILTISDRAHAGVYRDTAGEKIFEIFASLDPKPLRKIIPDDEKMIIDVLLEMSEACDLLVCTGGTGLSARDFTFSAMQKVCEKILSGFGEAMRAAGLKNTPFAMLSNQSAGVKNSCLILSLPGSVRAVSESLGAVMDVLPHAVALVSGKKIAPDPENHEKSSKKLSFWRENPSKEKNADTCE